MLHFGLSSGPFSFQILLNHILKPHVNSFVLVYLDDVLIFSNTLDEHLNHISTVLTLLEPNHIQLRLSKCFWAKNELEYLGHMVSSKGLSPIDTKVKAVIDWPKPNSVHTTQQWLGFVKFCRRYIKNYSKIAQPLYYLTKKDKTQF